MTGKHVYEAIKAVSAELAAQGIKKDQRNSSQNYQFRGIDSVLDALAPLLPKHNLCIIPRVVSYSCQEGKTKSGSPNFHVFVEVEYDVVSTVDGSVHTARMVGEAMDQQDKAANKAVSASYKYMAFQLFCIPVEGMDDADAHTPEPAAREEMASDDQATQLGDWLAVKDFPKGHANRVRELLALHSKKELTRERAASAISTLEKQFNVGAAAS